MLLLSALPYVLSGSLNLLQVPHSLETDGTPEVLGSGERATINQTDANYMVLLIENAEPAEKADYTIANDSCPPIDYSIPAQDTDPRIYIENWQGSRLTITDTSAARRSKIRVALYNISGRYGQKLNPDNEAHILEKYNSSWFNSSHENYYDLWIQNQSECGAFIVYSDGKADNNNDNHPIVYYVKCNDTIQKNHTSWTTEDHMKIPLKIKSWLYVLNVSPTNSSSGDIRFYPTFGKLSNVAG